MSEKKEAAPDHSQVERDREAAEAVAPKGDTAPGEASAVSDVEPRSFKVKFEDGVSLVVDAVHVNRAVSAARDRLRQVAEGEAEVDEAKGKK